MRRVDGRFFNDIRPLKFIDPFQKNAKGSAIIQVGDTIVNCSISIENKVPPFLNPETEGWLTSEYSMLPASTHDRIVREASKGKQSGRTVEIQRLIGRTLRSVIDLKKIPGKTIWIDCDVLQADGGTRTAAISGSSVALSIAMNKLLKEAEIAINPQIEHIAAISLGIVEGEIILDLKYEEDSKADVDMNLVMTESGRFVEIQVSSEGNTFTDEEFQKLLLLGKSGIDKIFKFQKEYLQKIGL